MPELVGVWKLNAFHAIAEEDGQVLEYFGQKPKGRLIYTDSGYVQVAISRNEREKFTASIIDASEMEKAQAFDSFDAYSGRYSFDPKLGQVQHHTDIDRMPNYEGTVKTRAVTFDGPNLILTTVEAVSAFGKHWQLELKWEREV